MSPWKVKRDEILPKNENPLGNVFYGYRRTNLVLPDGRDATYYGVVVQPCVHIVAVEDDLTTYLVSQKRPNVRSIGQLTVPETLELPGGLSNPNVSLAESAQNELRQEIKRSASILIKIGSLYPSTGISNEEDHIFLGLGLEQFENNLGQEATEQDLQIVEGSFGKIFDQITQSQMPVSAQTVAAFALAARLL